MTMNLNRFRSLAVAAAVAVAALTANVTTVHAEDKAAVAQVEALSTVMRDVGKAVEPSVVDIAVVKRVAMTDVQKHQLKRMRDMQDQLKKMFPNGEGNNQDSPNDDSADDNDQAPNMDERGEGSGVILDATADKAYILTNNHVASDASKFVITLSDGRKIEDVKVLGTDPLSDLAVLEIKAEGLTAVRWGNSDTVDKGDIVMAFGAPFGYVGSMTQGIVSGKNRTTNPLGGVGLLGIGAYEYFIQTDCAINPGNSGGPLINIHGELVGINTAIASNTGSFNGIGFAVPSNLAHFVYDQLKQDGKVTRGFLGVGIRTISELPKAQAEHLSLANRKGVYVGEVRNDSPAAGKLEVNDVILSVDGQPVATREELRLKVATTKPGTEVKLNVLRDGKEQVVPVALGTFADPNQVASAKNPAPAQPAQTGMGATLASPTAARAKSAGLPANAKGALVTGIKTGSPAELAGLAPGDLITKVNDTDVTDAETAAAAIKEGKLADGISLTVVNKEGKKSVFIQADQ